MRRLRVAPKRLALAAFVLWETWWAYVFTTAPVPEYRMDAVFAVLMGVALPAANDGLRPDVQLLYRRREHLLKPRLSP